MSNARSATKSAPAKVKDKDTETDTSPVSQTVRTREPQVTREWEDSQEGVGTTGMDVSDKVRCGLPGNKGLKIIPVPGGLYQVRNLAGGQPPSPMGGWHTELARLQELVYQYNKQVK